MRGRDHGQCLTEETLTEYLEGRLDPPVKAASEVHLIACDDCRSRLGFFMHLLAQNVSGEEAKNLERISAEWDKRKRKADVLRRTAILPKWLVAVAAAAILVLGAISARFVMDRWAGPKSANEVVQLLLAQHRPFESQMADEPHLPIVRTRGTEQPGVSYSLLSGEMTKLSASHHEMGRFYLLQKDFDLAIMHLEIAERDADAGAAVHNDLGVAYLENADGRNVGKAEQEFHHAIQADPKFAPAVFNLAVFYERTNDAARAVAEWKHYLQVDSKSEWAKEAKSRLQVLSR